MRITTSVTETCRCGASFQASAVFPQVAYDLLDDWRRNHRCLPKRVSPAAVQSFKNQPSVMNRIDAMRCLRDAVRAEPA